MLHDTQRTSAPRSTSVSMSTAVCTVMCRLPMIFAPLSGNLPLHSSRTAIKPGISCSARRIALRHHSASERSATLEAGRAEVAEDFFLSEGRTAVAIGREVKVIGAYEALRRALATKSPGAV